MGAIKADAEKLVSLVTADQNSNAPDVIKLRSLRNQLQEAVNTLSQNIKTKNEYVRAAFREAGQRSNFSRRSGARSSQAYIATVYSVYKICNEILALIREGDDPTFISYAIYFEDKKHQIHRVLLKDINIKDIRVSKSKGLMIRASHIKQLANNDAADELLTAHYTDFVTALRSGYERNGTVYHQNKTTIYDIFMQKKIINQGHVTEAFERHLANPHGINSDKSLDMGDNPQAFSDTISMQEAWSLLRQSRGNAAWYTGGDVGLVQVKDITSGDVKLSSWRSMEDIANYLLYLTEPSQDIFSVRARAQHSVEALSQDAETTEVEFVGDDAQAILEKELTMK